MKIKLMVLSFLIALQAYAQQEYKGRALVAFNTADKTTFISWRYFDGEQDYTYRLYRNGEKMLETKRTSHTLPIESALSDKYMLEVLDASGSVIETSNTVNPYNQAKKIALTNPGGSVSYTPNDISIGDADGDGETELIVKWDPSNAQDNSKSGNTSDVIIDCYKLDGKRLWSVNLGPNIRAGQHYTQFLVYDFDGDGKAELICKTAPGSKDGQGNYVSAAADDDNIKGCNNTKAYRNSNGHVLSGPEFLTVFNGETGAAVHTIWYNPDRAMGINKKNINPSYSSSWGDSYGNRGERFNSCVAYLDGLHPTAIFNRGYYTQAYYWAVDYQGGKLVHRWLHASVSNSKVEIYDADWNKTEKTYSSNTCGAGSHFTAYGNGNHNISVGDYDGDGKDEITGGSAAIDDDGQLMYSVGFGHGDAIHVGKMIPSREGFQVFHVHEEGNYGWDVHDAATGEVLFSATGAEDNGRGIAADIISTNGGWEFSSSNDRQQRAAATGEVVSSKSSSMNFRLYWDGSLQDNLADGGLKGEPYVITGWNGSSFATVASFDKASCNDTKSVPNLICDLFGDWREEVILHDDNNLYIYSTAIPTNYNLPCLLTDHTYRMAIAWQQSSYNQPPHLGYYPPTASTTINVKNAAETLFYDPQELINGGVQRTEIASGNITWALTSGTEVTTEVPTYAESMANYFSASSITLGSKITAKGTKTNGAGQTHTQFQPTEKASAASDDNAIKLMFTLKEGYEFAPTKVSIDASRWGTNGGYVDVKWISGTGEELAVATAQTPERAVDSSDGTSYAPYFTNLSKTLTTTATSGTMGVKLNVYGLADNKQISFGNLVINGKLYSSTSGIREQLRDIQSTGKYYNLQGVEVSHPDKGVYIHQGKKIVIR